MWICHKTAPCDPFHPYFILGALQNQSWMKDVVFGIDYANIPLLTNQENKKHPNPIHDMFMEISEFNYISLYVQ